MTNEQRKRFEKFFIEITNPKNWKNGKPVYDGYVYVTVGNALESFIDEVVQEERRRMKIRLLDRISEESFIGVDDVYILMGKAHEVIEEELTQPTKEGGE